MSIFKTNIINIYGNRGKAWLEDLPELVKSIAEQYGLSALAPVKNLSYNYVLSGFQGVQPIIVKLSLDANGLKQEAAALQAFSGFGAVSVLAAESDMLLLDRAVPGDSLKSYFPARENESIHIACDLMHRLHQAPLPEPGTFPDMKGWLMKLDRDWDLPSHYLHKARALRDSLLASSAILRPVLLHGDLHHDNILSKDDDWVVIDPKGVVGYPVNELFAFMNNPEEMSAEMLLNRVHLFSQRLSLDEKQIVEWCFVQSVLSWIWDLEDNLAPSAIWFTNSLYEQLQNF